MGMSEIVDFPIKNGGSFHCYVSLPEGKHMDFPIISHMGLSENVGYIPNEIAI